MYAFIVTTSGPWLRVSYEGTPDCLWCGLPVTGGGSMDGPLVCGSCDMGYTRPEMGELRKQTAEESRDRRNHFANRITEIRASQSLEDIAAGWVASGRKPTSPETQPEIATA